MLDSVGRNGIICSGVSAGSRDVVVEYTKTMSDIILHTAIVSDALRTFWIIVGIIFFNLTVCTT